MDLDKSFQDAVDGLQEGAESIGMHPERKANRKWQYPSSLSTGPLEVDKIENGFKRDDIGSEYAKSVGKQEDARPIGETGALKLQSDFLASFERAFRMRHSSPVRNLFLAAGRRRAHGAKEGFFQNDVVNEALNRIAEASTVKANEDGGEKNA